MANFLPAYKLTVASEGLWSNDEGDSGGETVLGLTRNTDPDWAGWHIVDMQKGKDNYPNNLNQVHDTLETLAIPYYKNKFWNKIRGDEILVQEEANKIFDMYVNKGTMGITLAQRALGIAESGHMDNITLNTLNNQV